MNTLSGLRNKPFKMQNFANASFTWRNRKFQFENQMDLAIPLGLRLRRCNFYSLSPVTPTDLEYTL